MDKELRTEINRCIPDGATAIRGLSPSTTDRVQTHDGGTKAACRDIGLVKSSNDSWHCGMNFPLCSETGNSEITVL